MKKLKSLALKSLVLLLALVTLAGCGKKAPSANDITEVPAEGDYGYTNPEATKAEPDAGIVIDGVLDEDAYKNNNWLYLNNNDGGNNVNIAMTSYYGQKGMYFVYDVTESVPIYVNPDRASYMNSCIEMYLAPSTLSGIKENSMFEIDMMPNGDMTFKKSNGQYGYTDVTTTADKMAVLGTTTKGGEINTPECYGYCLELFIPWEYMTWLKLDAEAMKNSFVYVNPAHITSNNLNGTDTNLDRYWYHFAQQNGAEFTDLIQYFRFGEEGVIGSVPVILQQGEHYTISGNPTVLPGMNTVVNIVPEEGYALTSILVNGEEYIQNADFNEDGSVTLKVRSTNTGVKVSAKAEAITQGKKTLSGKVVLNNLSKDSLKDLVLTYIGPKGEKPLEIDAEGKFHLEDMEQGYYILKAEKEGYKTVNRGICLNQDFYTELVLEYDFFQVTKGSCWILDEQNNGVLYKQGGTGSLLSKVSYNDFTLRANLKYDPELATQGTGDLFTQQRIGVQIRFSNEKTWHIDMLKEKDEYVLQYAKFSGDDSVTGWKAIHKLNAAQIKRYTGKDGIQLRIMRQGNYAAIWLGDDLIKVEVLDAKYNACSAQIGFESWVSNRQLMEIPFSIENHSTVYVKGSPFLEHAKSWNISGQYNGKLIRYPLKDRAWLDSVINANDVTATIKDLSPETKDFSFAYIFKFSNGEQLRIRLNHTDDDGAYRVQSMGGSTLAPAWKNGYTLTEEEAKLVKGDGIEYRVQVLGTTAYVYIGGKEVCTYDLSTVIATGKPSGIEKATSKVSFSLDGNMNGSTVIPFKLRDTTKTAVVNIADTANGKITADKESYKLGETITLKVAGNTGYYYTEVRVNGQKVEFNWDGTYSFKAAENIYYVTGAFATGKFQENKSGNWNLLKQNQNLLYMTSHKLGNSGWLNAAIDANEISTTIKDTSPDKKNFAMIYHFDFSNGEALRLSLNNGDGKYRVQAMSGSTVSEEKKNYYTLSAAEEAKVKGEGLNFRVRIDGANADVYLDDSKVCTIDLSKVIATGKDSGVETAAVRVKIRMDGNLGQDMEIPFTLIDTKRQVIVNIGDMTNGEVTADKPDYQLGDTVILTVTPKAGYSQKVSINGEPLLLDWKTNTYRFVANEKVYNITGSFEPNLTLAPSDAVRWDTANQAQGVLNAYYPANDDSWWMDIKGNYKAITVKAKNYLSVEDSQDGNGKVGFATILRVTMDNGKIYAFRVINDKGTYAYGRYGAGGSVSGWGNWKNLNHLADAFNGDGVDFKLERIAGNKLTLSVNGTAMETYTMDGVTADNKVASVSVQHNGNKGEYVEIPFALTVPTDAPSVKLNIAALTNGIVTPEQTKYQVGDTVSLTVSAKAGYAQKLYINGEPLLLDWKTNTYSFVATEEVYNITGSFEPSLTLAPSDGGRWDSANQAHGFFTAYYPVNDDSWWMDIKGDYKAISVKAKNYLPVEDSQDGNGKVGFATLLRVTMDNGKVYAFRVINDKGTYAYDRYGAGGSVTGWGNWKNLNHLADAFNGDGVDFKLERTAADKLTLFVNDVEMETYTMAGVTAGNKVVSVSVQSNGNKGEYVDVPFVLTAPGEEPPVEEGNVKLTIAELTNGKVTADKTSYNVGDTVTLTVTPNSGYAQKLYINGEPLLLDWKTNTYSFVATEEVYNITGSFVSTLPLAPSDGGRWDSANQAHGILSTYYPANNDSWWMKINGGYESIAVNAKNYLAQANSIEGNGNVGFSVVLGVTMDNNKLYAFRIINNNYNGAGRYEYTRYGASGSVTGWSGWCVVDEKVSGATSMINGDGAQFKLTRNGANTLQITLNGVVLDTYTMDGVTAANKVASVSIYHYGNKGQLVDIPYVLTTPTVEPPAEEGNVKLTIAELTNGKVTADKTSYNIGDTVTLTVSPNSGYSQKLYINGEPLLLDWKTNTYRFVAQEENYNITGSFVPNINMVPSDGGRWDSANQAHGILNAYYPVNNDSWWMAFKGNYKSATVGVKNYLPIEQTLDNFLVALRVTMDNGRAYSFRVYTDPNGSYAYNRFGIQNPGDTSKDWSNWRNLSSFNSVISGEGAQFKVERTGGNVLTLSINGQVLDTYTMAGVTADNKITEIAVMHQGNQGQYAQVPFVLSAE